MPLALAAISVAGTVAGTAMTIAGNMKSQRAIDSALTSYNTSQDQLSRQSNAIAQKSIAGSGADVANQEMNAGQDARMSVWDNLQKSTTPIASALPATATGASGGAQARSGGAANTWNRLNAKSAAREGSYADWQTQQAIKNSTAAQQISENNDFAGGNARLLPTELQVASQAGDKLTGWGNIVSSLGQIAGLASATGAKPATTGGPGVSFSDTPANVGFDENTTIPTKTFA